ncbi:MULTISPECIES: cysteine-rich CWC family protein [unclassified Sporosarcina]|uniref:cysteine-rich CWC family protein n=1 Tax=unclassified Sporosarcina TaxID=2647733 RepID=UPI000C1666BA|nr:MULTISPECIES: cysteine-rich CWC family protein [unclassified Sporosarcina]PID00949.1 hypothetical protein CSV68_01640 [Sporosarcina sp. P29]PID04889.1 hypothetical protein CSV66_12560 [Sporosarcina sp. P30]PID08149.1 hypothetical protein CSV65_12225 [Sporosarcina sp. P31]PID11229.1 hypothetical protein CSV64_12795 [Sporosarcina sp. P32b]
MKSECPICRGNNLCGTTIASDERCWCTKKHFPEEVFRQIPKEELHKQCICETCLNHITEIEQASKRSMDR